MHRAWAWLRPLVPPPLAAARREVWLGSVGAGLALLLLQWLAQVVLGQGHPWFVAPMGAAAVLLFALPASPLAQPWPVLAGNALAAAIGVAWHGWLGPTATAAALAGGTAIAAMFALRCLHPPAVAVAVIPVLGGPAVTQLGWGFAGIVVPAYAGLLLLLAVGFNNLLGRRYPHNAAARAHPHGTTDAPPTGRALAGEDIDAAMAAFGEVLDIDRGDLEEILARAQVNASRRHWGEVRCRDIMSRDVVTVAPEATLAQAWQLLLRRRVKALPVVDGGRRLVGIVSMHDFFLGAADGLPQVRAAARIEQLMTRSVRVARPERPMAELVEAFSDGGLHHMPVIDGDDRVIGMITQSDVVAALFLAQPGAAAAREMAPAHTRIVAARVARQAA